MLMKFYLSAFVFVFVACKTIFRSKKLSERNSFVSHLRTVGFLALLLYECTVLQQILYMPVNMRHLSLNPLPRSPATPSYHPLNPFETSSLIHSYKGNYVPILLSLSRKIS